MKRFIVAGVAALTLAGGAFALANTLSPTSDSLGAGSAGVAAPACAPVASYATTWQNTATAGFYVTTVTATESGCDGKAVQGELTGTGTVASGYNLASTTFSSVTHTASWTIANGTAAAADVTGISFVVSG